MSCRSSKLNLCRICVEPFEKTTFQQPDKEALSQILGLIGGTVPTQPNVLVDRLPIGGAKRLKGPLPLSCVAAAYRFDHGAPSRRETLAAELEVLRAHRTGVRG